MVDVLGVSGRAIQVPLGGCVKLFEVHGCLLMTNSYDWALQFPRFCILAAQDALLRLCITIACSSRIYKFHTAQSKKLLVRILCIRSA